MLTKADYNGIADAFDELAISSKQARALSEVITAAVPSLSDEGDTLQIAFGLLIGILEANEAATVSLQKRLLNLRVE